MKKSNNSLDEIRNVIFSAKDIAIVGHTRPDGDCVSSCLGMYNYLKNVYGIEADVYLESFADSLKFLPGSSAVRFSSDNRRYELVISFDNSEEARIGEGREIFANAGIKVCIDHHITNDGFGDYNYIIPDSSSACEVLYDIIDEEKLDRDTAVCIYTGIIHDTGVFQYSCVSPETMRKAGRLISFGFDFPAIIQESFYMKSYDENRAAGYAVEKSQLFLNGFGIWSSMSTEEMQHFNIDSDKVDAVVQMLRNTKNTDISVFLYQRGPEEYKASFRSNNYINVSELAKRFGGGGHVRAAGCTFYSENIEEMINMITEGIYIMYPELAKDKE